jgi:ferric-dicitrate binding protein FerR (iron transport regulator)
MNQQNNNNDERIALYLSGEMTPEDMGVFFVDLDNDPQLVLQLEEASKVMNSLEKEINVEDSLQNVKIKAKYAEVAEDPVLNSSWRKSKRVQWMVAASITVLLASSIMFYLYTHTTKNYYVIETKDNILKDTLPDGTVVTLNEYSLLRYAYEDSEQRRAKMEGEIFFEVNPDKSRPFYVDGDHVTVRVLGTSFLVQDKIKIGKFYNSDSVHVIVETGKVAVSNEEIKDTLHLSPGERVDFRSTKPKLIKKTNHSSDHLYWKDQMIVFRKMKLHKVIKKLNELYGADIELSNEDLKNCKISASFKGNSLKEVLDVIGLTFNLKIAQGNSKNKFIISGEACQ